MWWDNTIMIFFIYLIIVEFKKLSTALYLKKSMHITYFRYN